MTWLTLHFVLESSSSISQTLSTPLSTVVLTLGKPSLPSNLLQTSFILRFPTFQTN